MNEYLFQLIKMSGLSRKEISEKSGFPAPRISEWYNGKKAIQLESLKKIAESIGFEIKVHVLNPNCGDNSTIGNKPEAIGISILLDEVETTYKCGCQLKTYSRQIGLIFHRMKGCKISREDHLIY